MRASLGPRTENLGMRYWLNSGPPTAGVVGVFFRLHNGCLIKLPCSFVEKGSNCSEIKRTLQPVESSSLPKRRYFNKRWTCRLGDKAKGGCRRKGKGVVTTYWIEPDDQPTMTGIRESSNSDDSLQKSALSVRWERNQINQTISRTQSFQSGNHRDCYVAARGLPEAREDHDVAS